VDDEQACRELAGQGKLVVLKRGPVGCRVYAGTEVYDVGGFTVPVVDPTGAGDTFCGAFAVAMLDGLEPVAAARFANAAGALAVTRRGPMEGTPTRDEINRLLHNGPEAKADGLSVQ
jgi:sugar/nucleoside kinase (ribokinase family)